jgi:hypothetical protein
MLHVLQLTSIHSFAAMHVDLRPVFQDVIIDTLFPPTLANTSWCWGLTALKTTLHTLTSPLTLVIEHAMVVKRAMQTNSAATVDQCTLLRQTHMFVCRHMVPVCGHCPTRFHSPLHGLRMSATYLPCFMHVMRL